MNKNKRTKFQALGMAALLFFTSSAVTFADAPEETAAAHEQPALIGMPNPMVEYTSIPEMQDALGFLPLTLPESMYTCTNRYIIAKSTADLRYTTRDTERPSTYCIRSARQTSFPSSQDISGMYGFTWWPHFISRTNVFLAKTGDSSYAARWSNDQYLFSATADNVDEADFNDELLHLVSTTEEDYTRK